MSLFLCFMLWIRFLLFLQCFVPLCSTPAISVGWNRDGVFSVNSISLRGFTARKKASHEVVGWLKISNNRPKSSQNAFLCIIADLQGSSFIPLSYHNLLLGLQLLGSRVQPHSPLFLFSSSLHFFLHARFFPLEKHGRLFCACSFLCRFRTKWLKHDEARVYSHYWNADDLTMFWYCICAILPVNSNTNQSLSVFCLCRW